MNKAVNGKDVTVAHLEKWADGLGLNGDQRARFISLGLAAKGDKSKRLRAPFADMHERALRAEDALLSIFPVLEALEKRPELKFKIPKSARQVVEATRKLRGI